MSARQILRTAHQLQLVPRDLYGRTQPKTMQARLASDILKHRSKSEFCRTGPGRFFLRTFLFDERIPQKYRREYQAPLRAAQLGRFDVIAFPRAALAGLAATVSSPFPATMLQQLPWRSMRLFGLRGSSDHEPFRFRLLLVSQAGMFVHDQRPSEEGDLPRRQVVGISGVVKRSDRSLFSNDPFGLVEAATRTLFEQFELPSTIVSALEHSGRWSEANAVLKAGESGTTDLMVFIGLRCGDIVELAEAVNARTTSDWLPFDTRPNDLSHFDPWSARLLIDRDLRAALGC